MKLKELLSYYIETTDLILEKTLKKFEEKNFLRLTSFLTFSKKSFPALLVN